MNENELKANESPYLSASFLSRLTFTWYNKLLGIGRKKQLALEDLYDPLPDERTRELTDEFEKEWNNELKNNPENPSITRPLKKIYGTRLVLNCLFIFLQEMLKIIQPYMISLVLKYFNGKIDLKEVMIYAAVISVLAIVGSVLHHPYYLNTGRYGIRLRLICSTLIYRKVLRLNILKLDSKSAGDTINLIATDAARVENGLLYLPYLIIGPIQACVVIAFVVSIVGVTFIAGMALFVLIIPMQILLGKAYNKFRAKACKKTDERISLLTEILNSIKIIKMYVWEKPFSKRVTDARNNELGYQKILNLTQALNATVDTSMATLMTLINVVFFINLVDLKPIIPTYIVFSIGFYMRLCNSMGFNFTRALTSVINARVSLKRINQYLLMRELATLKDREKNNRALRPGEKPRIELENFNYHWSDTKDGFNLSNINIKVEEGQFVAIVGHVGSGKTTLLMSMLGELENYTGRVTSQGKIFYIAQQPWVFTSSIRQNILFGMEYDKDKFDKICEVCSLKKDLELLPYGENTLIGEKGLNLSGGQRARVCMARALYSDSDIYFFDDSLSAVDGTVAKSILKNCINGYLKNKTRILVTHQVLHLEDADNIIVLKNGSIEVQGNYNEIKTNLASLSSSESNETADSLYEQEKSKSNVAETTENEKKLKVLSDEMKEKEKQAKKEREEIQQKGSVSFKAYAAYFRAGAGVIGALGVMFFFLAAEGMIVAADYWLSLWATREETIELEYDACVKNPPFANYDCVLKQNITTRFMSSPVGSSKASRLFRLDTTRVDYIEADFNTLYSDRNRDFYIYLGLSLGALLVIALRSIFYFMLCIASSRNLYNKMFMCVRDTAIKFYEINPLGRIINRFTKDTSNMDEMLVSFLYEFLQITMVILGALVVPLIIIYWMIIPLVLVGILFYFIRNYFIPSARELKRLDNIARSPIFGHANSTIEGMITVRSAGQEELLTREFELHSDRHTRAAFGFLIAHRWFGLRLDLLCAVYTIITLFACILLKDNVGLTSGKVGILMVYLFQLFDLFQWCVVLSTYVENLMTSVERIVEYTELKKEPLEKGEIKAAREWPQKGAIDFKEVSLSYDKNLPDVLKKISLDIKSGEKIGIVGRTGAGKSSFFQILFRMYEPSGLIKIDGVDIKQLSLHELRDKLTIIPQEPILFSGSIRTNLDPFLKYTDNDLWNALESTNLKEFVKDMSGGLDGVITSGGSNLSVGQKQLICLARAILKKTRILIIDEATANVDYKTDAQIQKTIREQFVECTVLTIAHRLATVVDNDRIMCLADGNIVNFDQPLKLLLDETSILHQLYKNLSPTEKRMIYETASKGKSISPEDIPVQRIDVQPQESSDSENEEVYI